MNNNEKLFQERYVLSDKLDAKFVDLLNQENGSEKAIKFLKDIGAKWIDIDDYLITYRINEFTKNCYSNNQKERMIKSLKDGKYIQNACIKKNKQFNKPEAIIDTAKGKITAIQFSSIVSNIKKIFPFIETSERTGKCFEMSYGLSSSFKYPNDLVTGYIYGYSDKSEFLHSWVETTVNGQEYVIDSVLNAFINKEGYYCMRKAKPITRINNKTLRSDINTYLKGKIDEKEIPLPMYLLFRDEIIQDFEKNKQIFEER